MSMMRPGALSVQDFAYADRHTWILSGRLDRDSAAAFATMAGQLGVEGAQSIVVDLGNLTHLDVVGLAAVVRAREMCEASGCAFSLAPLSRALNVPSARLRTPRQTELQGARVQHKTAATRRLGGRVAGRRATSVQPAGS